VVNLPEPGLYTLYTYGAASQAQGWLVDSCRKAVLCPRATTAPAGPEWRPVLTAEFTAGRHSFVVTLPPGAGLGRVRLERKKDTAADYIGTLDRLGFEVGPSGPIARSRAVEAMEFVRNRRPKVEDSACGDLPETDVIEAGLAEPSATQGPDGPIFAGNPPGDTGVPLPGPSPDIPVASPPPVTTPPVQTTPPPTTPPESPGPPPTTPPSPPSDPPPTVPPQPPGSPVILPTPPA
jgi:hypothetical protein